MNILIADFDRKFVEELQRNWSIAGTNLLVCSDEKTLMPLIKKTSIDLAFIEVPFLMLDNMDLISYLKERQPGVEIFVLCDDRNWQGAASAITRGASSFLKKPVTLSLLESTASKIQAQQQNKSNTQLMESQVLDSLLGDTPEMRNAEMIASVCYAAMQLYYAYLQLIELRRMQTALHNYYDRERSSLLNWMRWSVAVLSVLALMAPILIYMQGLILTVYALMLFVGIFYMWLQFIGYIRTNAAERMREAEETMDEDGCNEEAELDDAPVIAAAAERWLADGKHLHNGITIKTAAEEMGVARCRLTAWLKQTDYEQFTAWITYHRIEAAKRLLKQHSDWSNEAVAQACGFSTRNYFQTVFKKEVGMTPSEYQQKD